MDSVNNSMENDELLLDKCMEDYVKEVIKQGITTINQDHILECCNGTSVNNCTIQRGKNNLSLEYFIDLCFIY
jgi:hypothetical protein